MKNLYSIPGFLLFVLFSNSYANKNENPELVSITPATIKMRHAQDVLVNIKNWQTGSQLSITPGGAYIKSSTKTNKHTFEIDNDGLKKIFGGTFIQSSTSSTHACLLLNHHQIATLNLSTQKIIRSQKSEKTLQQIIAMEDTCLTTSNENQVLLWGTSNRLLMELSAYQSNAYFYDAVIQDDKFLFANGNTGLTILQLKQNKLHWLGSYNKLGNIRHIAIQEKWVMVADERGILTLLDISNSENPLLISDFNLQGNIQDLHFKNDIAEVIQNGQHIKIDFSAKSTPIISTLGVNQGGSRRSFIKDNILYVADWFSGIHLYDISISHAPRLLSSFHTPGSPKGVVVRNSTIFIADDDHGLQIVDVSDPTRPVFISALPLTGLAYTMKLVDDHLYIASHRGGFHIVDVSDEKQPRLISTYDTPSKAWALAYQSGLLYVADDSSGLLVFDVRNPKQPKLINQYNPGGFAEDVVLKDNKAYIAFFDLGLVVLDISDPLNLTVLSQLKTPGNARGIQIKKNTLYLASWEAGVLILDISIDDNPVILSHYDTRGATWGLSVRNDTLYAMDWWGGIKILAVNDTRQPQLIGQYQTQGKINDILYANNFIYTAHGSRGLQVYDASNSLNPVWATGLDFDGDARAIALQNTLALIAAGDGGLVLADISNPFQVHWIAQLPLASSADMVQVIHQTAFVASKNGDLYIIDISDSSRPTLKKRHSSNTLSIKINGETLYQLNKDSTLNTYIVNKSSNIVQSTVIIPKVNAQIMATNGHLLYLATEQGQINYYDLSLNTHTSIANIELAEQLIALYLDQQTLYVTTKSNKLYVLKLNNKNTIELQSIYPTTHNIEQISASNNGIFFSGESIIASAKLLPEIKISQNNAKFVLKIPKTMPLDAYNLNITKANGDQIIYHNAVQVVFPKLKSKFSMEDFKRKMQEKNLPGKSSSSL